MILTIITINLNNKKGLYNTINSIINQTNKEFEWIIIDGGSTDGSKELIEKYQSHVNYWVSEADKGIYNAMNKGIAKSHGKYLLFLNSGDWLYDNFVIEQTLPKLGDLDIYFGIEIRNKKKYEIKISEQNYVEDVLRSIICKIIPHQSTFIRSRLFKIYGNYDENFKYASDSIFFFKTVILGNAKVKKIDKIITFFEGNGTSSNNIETYLKELNLFLDSFPRIKYLIDYYKRNNVIITIFERSFLFKLIYKILYKLIYKI